MYSLQCRCWATRKQLFCTCTLVCYSLRSEYVGIIFNYDNKTLEHCSYLMVVQQNNQQYISQLKMSSLGMTYFFRIHWRLLLNRKQHGGWSHPRALLSSGADWRAANLLHLRLLSSIDSWVWLLYPDRRTPSNCSDLWCWHNFSLPAPQNTKKQRLAEAMSNNSRFKKYFPRLFLLAMLKISCNLKNRYCPFR